MNAVSVGIGPLSIDDVVNVARFDAPVELTDEALATIADTRHRIEELANDPTPVYGISTGFAATFPRIFAPSCSAASCVPMLRVAAPRWSEK